MGQLKKRGRVWWIRYYRDGRRYEESSRSAKEGDARRLLRLREGDIERGLPVTPKIGRIRFEEAAKDLLNDYRTNGKRTVKDVERRIDLHLTPYFGGRRMSTISTSDVRALIVQRQAARASNAEINRELSALKRMFSLSAQAGKLLVRPYIPMLAERNVRTGFFERAEFETVREALPQALRGVVTFAYFTGWRIASEVLPLQGSQVDRTAKAVRLEPGQTKNAEGRSISYEPLQDLVTTIDEQWKEHERLKMEGTICPYVFNRQGKRISEFRDSWNSACETAGVPGKLLHDFRRTAVRNLVRAGVSEKTAMQITGHKTRSVFDRYDIVNEADVRAALGKLADANAAGTKQGQSRRSGRVTRFRRREKRAIA